MKAINYYLVIEKIKEAPKVVGGIEMTEKQDSDIRYLKAKVVGVEEGDFIRYDKHAGHGIEWDNKLFHVISAGDIVIVE